MKNTLAKVLTIAPAVLIILGLAIAALSIFFSRASAEEVPSRAALRIMDHIKSNQEIIDQTRDAHMQFMAAKDANIFDVGQLKALCYDYDWSSQSIKKIPSCEPLFQ